MWVLAVRGEGSCGKGEVASDCWDLEIESLLAGAGEAVEGARAMAGAARRMSSGHKGSWFVMT